MVRVAALLKKMKDYVWDYLTSTYFWDPVASLALVFAAFNNMKEPPNIISGHMTTALILYSMAFLGFIYRLQPQNYLMLMCHCINIVAQSMQAGRYLCFHYGCNSKAINLNLGTQKEA